MLETFNVQNIVFRGSI